MRALVALATLLVASNVHAELQPTIGVAVGAGGSSGAMLGDAPDIADGLGLTKDATSPLHVIPHAFVGLTGLGSDGSSALLLHGSWAFAHMSAGSNAAHVSYAARRDIFPVSVLYRFASEPSHDMRGVWALGPTVAPSRFIERGWLGDGTTTRSGYGGTAMAGLRFETSQNVALTLEVMLHFLSLPRHNPLLSDGGFTVSGGPLIGLEL